MDDESTGAVILVAVLLLGVVILLGVIVNHGLWGVP